MNNKHITVMAEYASDGLWDEDGGLLYADDLNLSPSTVTALKNWCSLYETNDDFLDEADRQHPLFNIKTFTEQGWGIAKKIKKELPEYVVVYFNECDLTRSVVEID